MLGNGAETERPSLVQAQCRCPRDVGCRDVQFFCARAFRELFRPHHVLCQLTKKSTTFLTASMLASCVALLLASAQGAVIGIDLGSRFLKVGIIQPGTGIELVLNEATKRKSSAVAGFNAEEERIYGDESYNLLGKLPEKQFLFSKMLLGKPLDSPEVKLLKELGYPYEFLEDEESKGAQYKYGNGSYKPEEAVAFVLSYAKQIAEAHAESVIKDCVITVPPYWRHEERPALPRLAPPCFAWPCTSRRTSAPPRPRSPRRPALCRLAAAEHCRCPRLAGAHGDAGGGPDRRPQRALADARQHGLRLQVRLRQRGRLRQGEGADQRRLLRSGRHEL